MRTLSWRWIELGDGECWLRDGECWLRCLRRCRVVRVSRAADTSIVLSVCRQMWYLPDWYVIVRLIGAVNRRVWVSWSQLCTFYVWIYSNVTSSLFTSPSWGCFIMGFWLPDPIVCPSTLYSIPIVSLTSALLILRIIIASPPFPSASSSSSMTWWAYLTRLLYFSAFTSPLPPAARSNRDTSST